MVLPTVEGLPTSTIATQMCPKAIPQVILDSINCQLRQTITGYIWNSLIYPKNELRGI